MLGMMGIDGKAPPLIGAGRPSPHYCPQDPSPLARGLVAEPLVRGLTPRAQMAHAASSRVGLISSTLNISSTGYLQRRMTQRMKDAILQFDMSVRAGSRMVQYYYADGTNPRWATRCSIRAEDLQLDELERLDPELVAAASAMRKPQTLGLPIALDLFELRFRGPAAASQPGDEAAVRAAASRLRPWEPSTLTRAALLLRMRRGRREGLGLVGERLRLMLDACVADWRRTRASPGMAVGVFVGSSLAPPMTQSALNSFQKAGGGTDDNNAIMRLVNNTDPDKGLGTFGMTVHTTNPSSRGAAKVVAARLLALRVADITLGKPKVRPLLSLCSNMHYYHTIQFTIIKRRCMRLRSSRARLRRCGMRWSACALTSCQPPRARWCCSCVRIGCAPPG